MRSMEMSAKTVEAAVQAACEALGVDRDDINVSYEVLEFPTRKLFKTIPAKVLVKVEEPEAAPAPAAEEKPAEVSTKPAEVVEISDETAPEIEKAVVEDMVEAAELAPVAEDDVEIPLDIAADPARAGSAERSAVDAACFQRAGRTELVCRKRPLRPQGTGDGRKPLYLHRLRGKVARGRQAAAADAPGYLARAARVQFARAVHVAMDLRRTGAVQFLAFEAALHLPCPADRDSAVFAARHAARAGNFHINVFVHNASSFRCSRISVLCSPSARYRCISASRG